MEADEHNISRNSEQSEWTEENERFYYKIDDGSDEGAVAYKTQHNNNSSSSSIEATDRQYGERASARVCVCAAE